MSTHNRNDIRQLVDINKGSVDRRIFVDEDIYKQELKHIFARAWNFMCHESQIPDPGDYFLNFIGEDSVIATRDHNGDLQVLLNTCRHRGNPVCKAEMGNTRSFVCTYHGWSYGLDGKLKGVPGHKEFYHEDLDREKWGMPKAAQVDSYRGFVFATMDPDAPPLGEFLGEVGKLGLDSMAAQGELEVVQGIQKNRVACNWKFAVDNTYDWYHPPMTHNSALASGYVGKVHWSHLEHVVSLGEYGHVISGPRMTPEMRQAAADDLGETDVLLREDESWRDTPEVQRQLGEFGASQRGHPGIFPNLWVASSATQLCLRLPRGPGVTELWWFTVLSKSMTDHQRRDALSRANHFFGPSGLFEQDDGENWDQGTRACQGEISKSFPMNVAMNVGRGEIKNDPKSGIAYIDAPVNEHGQLWTYQAWMDWMAADSWAELKENHSRPAGVL